MRWAWWTKRSRSVAEGGITDAGMPVLDRHLTGEQGRASARPVFDHLQEIPPFAVADRGEAPVVEERIVRMGILSRGTPSLRKKSRNDAGGPRNGTLRSSPHCRRVRMAGFLRNAWPNSTGMTGRIQPECVAGLRRNTQGR